jgi:hypothetical protein
MLRAKLEGLFEATWLEDGAPPTRRLVGRIRPSGRGVFPEYDLGLQFRCMDTLGWTRAYPPWGPKGSVRGEIAARLAHETGRTRRECYQRVLAVAAEDG